MALRDSGLIQLTKANVSVDDDTTVNVTRGLPLMSLSRVFYSNRPKQYVAKNQYKFLREAMRKHDMDLIKECLQNKSPLQPESESACIKTINPSLKPGSIQGQETDPSKQEQDLLALAATYGRSDILQLVLDRLSSEGLEADELYDLNYCLHQACKLNNVVMVEKLLEAKASAFDKGEFGFSAMHHAAYSGSLEVLKILVKKANCSIYVRTDDQHTPLHLAARKGFTSVVEFLLNEDEDQVTNVVDDLKNSPLHYACISGVDNVVMLLLRTNCPVNNLNYDDKSALYIAAEKGRSSIIPILISFGASIDVRCGPYHRTPLMAASFNGHVTAVSELITSGSSFQCTDSMRNSALELALDNNRDEAAALLILREATYSDYVHEFVRTQEFSLCKVLKRKLIKSAAALLDRMVIPEEGNTSQVKVKFRYLDTDVDNQLPRDADFKYTRPYFLKLISDLKLEELAYHGTVRLFVKDRMNAFGRFFLLYKTILFFIFLLSMFYSSVVAVRQADPNFYDFRSFRSVLRLLAETYVVIFWFSNVLTESFEVVEIFKRTWTYLHYKHERIIAEKSKSHTSPSRGLPTITEDEMELDDLDPNQQATTDSTVEGDEDRENGNLWGKITHWSANNLIVRFLMDYFSDSFNWFDQGGLAFLLLAFILRAVSSPVQWIVLPIAYLLNCMRFIKLFNVYYSFGTYIRILVSVSFNELPPFLLFFLWTLFVFSGAFYVSLRVPTVWSVNSTDCAVNNTSPGADCQVGRINSEVYTSGLDDEVWWVFLLGLRVLLEAAPVYDANYLLTLNWLATIIFLVFLFITIVIYLNLLIAQLTDRYSHVKKNALKVVAWYRLNFIIQSQDTSLVSRFYNFREKKRIDSIVISAKRLHKYYGVDSVDEFVERGSAGFRDYLPEVTNEQLFQHQRFTSRTHEMNGKVLSSNVDLLSQKLEDNNSKIEQLSKEMDARNSNLESKLNDITTMLSALMQKS